ncbi:MAG: hypothetical protein ACLRMJ_05605 [Alistipes finegoldii]
MNFVELLAPPEICSRPSLPGLRRRRRLYRRCEGAMRRQQAEQIARVAEYAHRYGVRCMPRSIP